MDDKYEVHHVDWTIIHSKLPAVPGISKFVHGIKVLAANIYNNKINFAPNMETLKLTITVSQRHQSLQTFWKLGKW